MPPDHAPRHHFSEKLVLLPLSYQVNYYERHLRGLHRALRGESAHERRRQLCFGGRAIVSDIPPSEDGAGEEESILRMLESEEVQEACHAPKTACATAVQSCAAGIAGDSEMDGVIRHARIARLLRARHGLVWMGSKRLRRQGVSVGMHKDGRKPPLRSSGDRLATSVGKLTAPLHFPFLVSSCAQDEPVPPPFVFVNFNKNDKLEPVSFGLWLRILGNYIFVRSVCTSRRSQTVFHFSRWKSVLA